MPDTNAVRPAIPMCGFAVTIGEVPSTLPFEASACTSKSPTPVGAEIDVSKPCFQGRVWSGTSVFALVPASTRHDATAVAPFQLDHSSVVPSLLGARTIAGGVVGWPLQGNL